MLSLRLFDNMLSGVNSLKEEACVRVTADGSSRKVFRQYNLKCTCTTLTTLEANFWGNCQSIKLGLVEKKFKSQGMTKLRQQDKEN